jgi:rRNA maturation protein Nop10
MSASIKYYTMPEVLCPACGNIFNVGYDKIWNTPKGKLLRCPICGEGVSIPIKSLNDLENMSLILN